MIGVVDYGSGNILSVQNALAMLGAEAVLCATPEALAAADRLILPGVGAFAACAASLRRAGLDVALTREALDGGKPILGICVGLQLMARRSFEGGEHPGLGWFEADVARLEPADPALRVPQIGWNDVRCRPGSPLFAGLPDAPDFYFVHSYALRCDRPEEVDATGDYGGPFTAAVRRGNIAGTQFHPEKSQDLGLKVLENFLDWTP